jgi:hypothetical protein
MKRIKLYEAFRSNILSRITDYLKKSGISDREKSNFLNDMNSILGSFKIPIDKIEDEDVDYKSYRDLWKVKAPEFQNEFDVFGIKFWFSVEGKYLGKTSIGNITSISGDLSKWSFLPEECMEYLREGHIPEYKTGKLIPSPCPSRTKNEDGDEVWGDSSNYVEYLRSLPNGTPAIAWLQEYYDFSEVHYRLTPGKIYQSEDGRVYLIHYNDSCDGITPSGNWENYGPYSWVLTQLDGQASNDHIYLSVHEEGENPIDYKLEGDKISSDDPEVFNTSISNVGKQSPFKDKKFKEIKDNANFGIYIKVDQILKRGGYKPTDVIKSEREEAKKGVIGGQIGLTDEELRKINIDRRINATIDRLGISSEGIDFTKIGDILSYFIGNWYVFELYASGTPYYLSNIIDNLINVISKIEQLKSVEDDKLLKNTIEIYLERIKESIIQRKKINAKLDRELGKYLEDIKSENTEIGSILSELVNFNKLLLRKVKETKFTNALYLQMFSKKIFGIKNVISNPSSEEGYLVDSYIKKFTIRESGNRDLYGDNPRVYTFNSESWNTNIDLSKSLDYVKTLEMLI